MIWKPCQLQILTEQTEDELGNLVGGEWKTVENTYCRSTPWTDAQIALEGREVTQNEQRFIIPIPYCAFPDCTHTLMDGVRQEITQKIDLGPRYTVLQVKVYKE